MNYNSLVNNLIKQGEFEKELTPQYLSEAAGEPICLIKGMLFNGENYTSLTSYITTSQDSLIGENITRQGLSMTIINLDTGSVLNSSDYNRIFDNHNLYIRLLKSITANVFIIAENVEE